MKRREDALETRRDERASGRREGDRRTWSRATRTAAEGRDEGLASVSIKTLIFGRVVCVLCSFELFMEIFGVSYHVVL